MTQTVVAVPLASKTAQGRSSYIANELVQNWYAEPNPQGSKSPFSLLPTPGLKSFATVGSGPIRGIQKFFDYLYVVSGDELYRVDEAGTSQLLGTIAGNGRVFMAPGLTQVFIATNTLSYSISGTASPVQTAISNLQTAASQDGYALAIQIGTEQFYISGIDDFTSWAALDFSSADTFSDHLVGLISDHREVWLFGKETIEVWVNTGAANFPFQRTGAGFMERGCIAPGSIAKADNRVFWLGDDLRVYTAANYQPQPISDAFIEYEIGQQTSPQTAYGFTYTQEGHTFYVLTMSSKTLVFDVTTGFWHTRVSPGETRWRANNHQYIWQKHIVGDFETGDLYELDLETGTDNGSTIQRRAIMPKIHNNGYKAVCDEAFVDIESGIGLEAGTTTPLISLHWTDDSGHTWLGGLQRSMGARGEYTETARWHGLGAFKERSFRITVAEPTPCRITGFFVRVEGLMI